MAQVENTRFALDSGEPGRILSGVAGQPTAPGPADLP
jgi:hypothetical protein